MNARLLLILCCASCAADLSTDTDCRRTDDCDAAQCVSGRCQSLPGPDATTSDTLDAAAATRRPLVDAPPGVCDGAARASPENLALNEVLAHVPTGPEGDANGDGVRDAFEDEFVELVNLSTDAVDLTGVRISSGGRLKHTFEPLCLAPGATVVVFGGGSVGPSVPGGALIAERRFALANDGGWVEVSGEDGVIARFDYGRAGSTSFTRLPQLWGPEWVEHDHLSPLLFSPGACPDGSPFSGGCSIAATADAGTTEQ